METTAPKYYCFVLMPFDKDFDDIYLYGIKESCKEAGTYCERVDEQIYQERILDRIYNQIAKADLIIADMTDRNPNVFYEVGYAHALNKPTILLTQNSSDIPFDLKHFPHIVYQKKISLLRDELVKRLKWFKENVNREDNKYKNEIDIYVDDVNLSKEEVVHEYPHGYIPHFQFTIHNNSSNSYAPGDFQIGIISKDYHDLRTADVLTTRLPDKSYLHMLPFYDLLLPGAYTSTKFSFGQTSVFGKELDETSVTIRLFTTFGFRDFFLKLKKGDRPVIDKKQ